MNTLLVWFIDFSLYSCKTNFRPVRTFCGFFKTYLIKSSVRHPAIFTWKCNRLLQLSCLLFCFWHVVFLLSFYMVWFPLLKITYSIITHADEYARVQRSPASVCMSICPHDRTKTAEITITKLATGIVHHSWVLASHLTLSQKVKREGYMITKVQKHI